MRGKGLWIPAGVTHQLKLSRVLCIYIDPNLDVCNVLLPYIKNPSKRSIRALDEDFITECLSRFTGTENLLIALKAFERQYRGSKPSGPKSRLSDVLEALNAEASGGDQSHEPSWQKWFACLQAIFPTGLPNVPVYLCAAIESG